MSAPAVKPFVGAASTTIFDSLAIGVWRTYDARIQFALGREETSVPAIDSEGNAFACTFVAVYHSPYGGLSVRFCGDGITASIPEREAEFIALAAAAWREQFGFDLNAEAAAA